MSPPEGGRKVVVSVHPSQGVGVVIAVLGGGARFPERPELPGGGVELVVVGDEHPALAGAEALVLVEAEGGAVAERADLPPVELRPVGLAAVLDDLQPVPPGDGQDRVHVRRQAVKVNHHDRPRLLADGGLDAGGVDVHRLEVDVHENGDGVVVNHAGGRGAPRVGRDDHLVARADPAGGHAHVKGGGAGVGGDGQPVSVPGGELFLKGLAVGPEGVGGPFQRGQHHLPIEIVDRGPALDGALGDRPRAAVDGQLLAHAAPPVGTSSPAGAWCQAFADTKGPPAG